jgi:hypothetical protein
MPAPRPARSRETTPAEGRGSAPERSGRLGRTGLGRRRTRTPTTRAVPTIMTGQLRGEGLLPTRADHPGSLFDRLGGQYDFNVEETLTHLCADELCGQTRATWPTRARRLVGSMASIMRSRLSPGESTDYIGVPPETIERRPETFREFVERIEPGRHVEPSSCRPAAQPLPVHRLRSPYTTETDLPGLSAEQWTEDPAQFERAAALPDAARPGRQAGRRARRTTKANRPLRPRADRRRGRPRSELPGGRLATQRRHEEHRGNRRRADADQDARATTGADRRLCRHD